MKLWRLDRELVVAKITRPDLSKPDLQKWRAQGYVKVGFVANPICCLEVCKPLEFETFVIDDLLKFDNPLYRTSHPNCECRFAPHEPSKVSNERSF